MHTPAGLQILLLLCALVAYAGAGALCCVARYRHLEPRRPDGELEVPIATLGLCAVACSVLAAGWSAVPAFGAPIAFTAYVAMARELGYFEVHRPTRDAPPAGRAGDAALSERGR